MPRWLLVACVLAAACGKKDRAPADAAAVPAELPEPPIDAPAIDAVVATASDPATTGTAKVLEVVIAGRVACARRTDGRVRCWGSPWDGLGLPVVAAPVELPQLTNAVSIELGADQTLYVVTDTGNVRRGTLDLRGTTQLAELEGLDDIVEVRAFRTTPVVLTRTGNVFTPASASPILTNAVALRRATNGSIQVLHRDGRVSWFDGKIHEVSKLSDAIALFGDRCAERRTGARVCWTTGRLVPWTGAANIVDRVHGVRFRCDLTGSGVACAGANDAGQLGTGHGPDRTEARSVDLPGKVLEITAGARATCAVLDRGDVACWGANDGGQLGDGTLVDRPVPIIVGGLTSAAPPPPSDGRAKVGESTTAMDWSELPAGCKRPAALASLTTVVSAYAVTGSTSTTVWLADFALEPTGAAPAVRGTQRALQLVLGNGKKPIDRGRYGSGKRTAKLTTHAAERSPVVAGSVDLVVELADKSWVCGQVLAVDGTPNRQAFAARRATR